MTIEPFPEIWTEQQLADRIGVSLRTVRRWRAQRRGPPFVSLGRRVLYRRAAVAEWLAANEHIQPRAMTS